MRIYYLEDEKKYNYIFLIRDFDVSLIFDCRDDEWRSERLKNIDHLKDIIYVDPMDLKMATSYIDLFKDKINFPDRVKKEFIRFTFESKIKRNI